MVRIEVHFLSILSDLSNVENDIIEIQENSTIRQVIDLLRNKIGIQFQKRILSESNDLNNYVILVINGKDIRVLNGLNTIIRDNDIISFLPALAGG